MVPDCMITFSVILPEMQSHHVRKPRTTTQRFSLGSVRWHETWFQSREPRIMHVAPISTNLHVSKACKPTKISLRQTSRTLWIYVRFLPPLISVGSLRMGMSARLASECRVDAHLSMKIWHSEENLHALWAHSKVTENVHCDLRQGTVSPPWVENVVRGLSSRTQESCTDSTLYANRCAS